MEAIIITVPLKLLLEVKHMNESEDLKVASAESRLQSDQTLHQKHPPAFHLPLFVSRAAMSHLNGQKVFGKVMRVTLSKHQTVALPREGLDDQLLTKGEAFLC